MCESAQIIVMLQSLGLQLYETLATLHVIVKDYDQKQTWKNKERLVFVQHLPVAEK